MKVHKRTPRTEMVLKTLIVRAGDLVQRLAAEMEVPAEAVDQEFFQFLRLSSRVQFENGEVDFMLAKATDTTEQLAERFIRYLDSGQINVIQAAWNDIYEMDMPADPVTGPAVPDDPTGK